MEVVWQLLSMQIKSEEDLDLDESLAPENESSRKQKPLHEKNSQKHEKFPSKNYNRWKIQIKLFTADTKAKGLKFSKKNCSITYLFINFSYCRT